MTDKEVVKFFARAEDAIILCYNLAKKKVVYAFYSNIDLVSDNPITIDEYYDLISEKVDIIIDKEKFLSNFHNIVLSKDFFDFPDVFKTKKNRPLKVNIRGGKLDSNNILINIIREKEIEDEKQDALTKCVPYSYFEEQIDDLIKNGTPFISGIIDIDNFKDFNAKYNHTLGDIVLIQTASIMNQICGTNGLVCRQGGDEFLFYYKIDNDYDKVHKFLTDFKIKIEKSINEIINVPDKLTITIGSSRFPLDGDNFNLLLIKNKAALIRGKKKARNCFIIYLEEKCGYVDEKTVFDKTIDSNDGSANISILSGVLEVLNTDFPMKKRIEDSMGLIGSFYYLDRIILTHVDPKNNQITDITAWYNPRTKKAEYKYSSKNISLWKSIYKDSNLLVINSQEEGEKLIIKDILAASNITACVAIELRHENRLYGQIRFEMTSINRHWLSSDISSFVLIGKMLSLKIDKEYTDRAHYKQMYFDSITNIFNLQKFLIEGELFVKNNNFPIYSVLDIGIYEFTSILNIYGSKTIEKLLKIIAEFLLRFDETDIIFGKTSNNRFSILFPGKDVNKINETFNQLKKFVKEKFKLESGDVLLQAGLYINEANVPLTEALDKAVIARKSNQNFEDVIVFSNKLYEKEIMRIELESHIETALENDEFVLYLQPKIDTKTKKVAGAEALSRWNYNFEKIIYPNDFIPVLEKNGYISRMDFIVFEKVCALQKRLQEEGYELLPISVNVSRSISNFKLYLKELEKIRSKYDISAKFIEIEITEGMYSANNLVIKNFISDLHAIGYKVSMDDFGSGYSNIIALAQLNFDIIKFDKSFLTNPSDEKETLIISSMTNLVKNLNMKVLCEGVETEEYDKYLTEIGCDYIQGYYYDKPLPVEAFEKKYIINK